MTLRIRRICLSKYCSYVGRILLVTILVVGFQLSCDAQEVSPFKWLIGTWERVDSRPGETSEEKWSQVPGGMLEGIGLTIKGGDTVFVEHLKILKRGDCYYYSANVSHNPAPVLFQIIEFDADSFASENPDHDFPKTITYRLEGHLLYVTIGDSQKQIPFRFKKRE